MELEEYGQNSPSWQAVMSDFASAKEYKARVIDFLQWFQGCKFNVGNESFLNPANGLETGLIQYFYHSRSQRKPTGEPMFCAGTLRGWFSIFLKFWKFTGKGNLRKKCTLIEDEIGKWEKLEDVKQSLVFSKHHIDAMYQLPDNEKTIVLKAFGAIAICFAGRPSEVHQVLWSDVSECRDENNSIFYKVKHSRKKRKGTKLSLDHIIIGNLEVLAVGNYVSLFPAPERKGKFFKYLCTKDGKIQPTKSNIGHNVTDAMGSQLACYLGLEEPNRYTGQCWRRSAATIMADQGASLMQIKSVTGHRSDSVVQGKNLFFSELPNIF